MLVDPYFPVVTGLPTDKPCPPDVRAMLKAVNPMVDAFYAGNGTWWILEYQPDRAGRQDAARRLDRMRVKPHARLKDLLSAQLMYEGWTLLFPFHSELGECPNSWCAVQLRKLMSITEEDLNAVEQQFFADGSGETKLQVADQQLRDRAATEGKSFFHIVIGNRVSVNYADPHVPNPLGHHASVESVP